MIPIEFTSRQRKIIEIVQQNEPITSQEIAALLKVTRATLRPDLAILTMSGTLDARPKVGYFYSGKPDINLISQEVRGMKVKDMMSIPVVVTEDMSVYNAIVTMFLEDTSAIYVVSGGSLVGVISRKDFLKNAIGTIDINKVPVAMIMTRMPNIATTSPEEDVLTAASKIVEHEVDSLPVVEKTIVDGKQKLKVVGKISKSNITKLFVELCKE
ncbi:helix-turn-helix transcriptional regulator [Clostridium formicaceticum]|uniref:Transcriptional regulator n=1 Tax=Clostridium formicaceticum TaxID=1497 RepID=A0AAC9RLD0_9CLOT|nr:helix-turn-helix transcriptional regulator [Clostridium formicaceticum]AOY77546.1 transcriptional regulator [Clostridium formicaceticum]ARE88121.1 Transcriptional repressor CcpN [Clostridium formicaceticum]